MRRALCILFLLFPAMANGDELYGEIEVDGGLVDEGVVVEFLIGEQTYTAETDEYGSYSLFVEEDGRGVLSVSHDGVAPSIEAYSYPEAQRYDLVLERDESGWVLKRK